MDDSDLQDARDDDDDEGPVQLSIDRVTRVSLGKLKWFPETHLHPSPPRYLLLLLLGRSCCISSAPGSWLLAGCCCLLLACLVLLDALGCLLVAAACVLAAAGCWLPAACCLLRFAAVAVWGCWLLLVLKKVHIPKGDETVFLVSQWSS